MRLYIVLILFIRIIKLYNCGEQNDFSKWIQKIPNFHKKQSLSCIHYTKSFKVKLQLDTKVDIKSYRILLHYM